TRPSAAGPIRVNRRERPADLTDMSSPQQPQEHEDRDLTSTDDRNDSFPDRDYMGEDRNGRNSGRDQRPSRGMGGGGSRKPPTIFSPRPLRTLFFWVMMTLFIVLAVHFYRFSKP